MSEAPDWPGNSEAAEAYLRGMPQPPSRPDRLDGVIAEGREMAQRALGCEVEPGTIYQIVPAEVGKCYIHWRPKRWWRRFWPFNRKHGARHANTKTETQR